MAHEEGEVRIRRGVEAARLRGAHPITLPDAYCLTTAHYADASVETAERRRRQGRR